MKTRQVRVAVIGGGSDFETVLDELGIQYNVFSLGDLEVKDFSGYDAVIICTTEYPREATLLSNKMLEKLQWLSTKDVGVYSEFSNFLGFEDVPQPRRGAQERIFVKSRHYVTENLPSLTILEEHDSYFLPIDGIGGTEILSYGRVPGTHKVLYLPHELSIVGTFPALISLGNERKRVLYSTTSLSSFRKRRYKLSKRWEELARRMLLYLLPEKKRVDIERSYIPLEAYTEPRSWVVPGEPLKLIVETTPQAKVSVIGDKVTLEQTKPGFYEADLVLEEGVHEFHVIANTEFGKSEKSVSVEVSPRKEKYFKAMARNISWLQNMLNDGDGSKGIKECVDGRINTDGKQVKTGGDTRVDCTFEPAVAFYLYWKLTRDERYKQIAFNLLKLMFEGGFQDMNKDRPTYGFWSWFEPWDSTTHALYGQVQGDAVIHTLYFFKETSSKEYLRRALLTCEGLLETSGVRTGLPQRRIESEELIKVGRKEFARRSGCYSLHYISDPLNALIYAHGATGDETYLSVAKKAIDSVLKRYPPIEVRVSLTSEHAQFLLPLSFLYFYTREEKYKEALLRVANFLFERQVECGAIREGGNRPGYEKMPIVVDGSMFHEEGEPISDQLYCTNFAVLGFYMAYKVTGERLFLDRFLRLMDFLVRIQVESEDPLLDGGWMRGFDFENWERYASNVDDCLWSAYAMETGWTNAPISMAIAFYLLDDSFFPFKNEAIEEGRRQLKEVRREMKELNEKWEKLLPAVKPEAVEARVSQKPLED